VDAQGRVTNNCKGEEKVRRLRLWLEENEVEADTASSCAYGDSKSDLPMLRLAGHPVQVNPKKALRKAAPGMERTHWTEK
jgi:phosphoserine phosphatase